MRTIDLESLKIFRTVVDEGGVVRAANKLNRVQSNVTTRIRQLEQHLGTRGGGTVSEMRTGKPKGIFRLRSPREHGR